MSLWPPSPPPSWNVLYWQPITNKRHHPTGWQIMKKTKTHSNDYPGGSWFSGKQYLQFIHEQHDEAGTGPGSPGPVWGCHRPMADIYDAARAARGAGDKSSTSVLGNNDCSMPRAIIENDILYNAVANWDNIWRFDNMTPASRWRMMAAASALSLPSWSTQNVGEQSSRRADSGAPTNSRNRGWWSCNPYAGFPSEKGRPPGLENPYGQPGSPDSNNWPAPKSCRRQRGGLRGQHSLKYCRIQQAGLIRRPRIHRQGQWGLWPRKMFTPCISDRITQNRIIEVIQRRRQ